MILWYNMMQSLQSQSCTLKKCFKQLGFQKASLTEDSRVYQTLFKVAATSSVCWVASRKSQNPSRGWESNKCLDTPLTPKNNVLPHIALVCFSTFISYRKLVVSLLFGFPCALLVGVCRKIGASPLQPPAAAAASYLWRPRLPPISVDNH